MKRISIFGSTGSIGRSALEIIRRYPGDFKVAALVANTSSGLLAEQIAEFKPEYASALDTSELKREFPKVKFVDPVELAAEGNYDVMLAAIVGFAGLESVLAAIACGKTVALANKEVLVAAGELIMSEVKRHNARLIPVDSEHSAIYQLLEGRSLKDLESITLTASGGPFFNLPLSKFSSITPQQAIKHPRWSMGPKISLDSATMFNKALEVIEARWLFGLEAQRIEVVVHPQSLIHALINFNDGASFAHLSQTDMQGPISYALNYPRRLPQVLPRLDLSTIGALEFLPVDQERFPAVALAKEALQLGNAATAVLNAANEAAGNAFLNGRISFPDIFASVSQALEQFGRLTYSNYEELVRIDSEVRNYLEKAILR